MERKYYLRGLGLGIAMTAIIMGVALSGNKSMTDEEIVARAKELGMVENTVLADMDSGDTEENTGDGTLDESDPDGLQDSEPAESQDSELVESDDETVKDAAETEDGNEGSNDAEESGIADVNTDETADNREGEQEDIADTAGNEETDIGQQEPESEEPKENANSIITSAAVKTITVNSGDGSYTVARKLADVGVVTSAETFDTFLCQNGYDKRLRPGTFSIPADASDEQIARIVTGAE